MAEPVAKKFKAADNKDCSNLFDGFQVKQILMNDVKSKKVHVLGLTFFLIIMMVDLILN